MNTRGDKKTWLFKVDATGNFSLKEIPLPKQPNAEQFTYDFCPAPGGGYAMAGSVYTPGKFGNSLLYKTDKDGNLLWQKELNIYMDDQIMSIVPTIDGYLLLAEAGFDDDWSNDVAGDIVLLKTDWQGNTQWKRHWGAPGKTMRLKCWYPMPIVYWLADVYPGPGLLSP
ncbi:hypothetical protein [Paraflavitalea speifideaquila]|uniref:hypothetical protein n=1 Tax=Paraflavitalea speifideaquila TaxID=3076558 RepID=UPI0028EB090F|nr:hypothetical protein [Paraflavitalea speifideiaquila]